MKTLTVEGKDYEKSEYMGFQHSIGVYCWLVHDGKGGEKCVYRFPKTKEWKWWTPEHRLGKGPE